MKWSSFIQFFLVFVSIPFVGFCQTPVEEEHVEQLVESMVQSTDGQDLENSLDLDEFIRAAEGKIDVNRVGEEELSRLGILDFHQIKSLLDYRKKHGYFISAYELAAVDGITPEIIASLAPLLKFSSPEDTLAYTLKYPRNRLILRSRSALPLAKGYSSSNPSKGAAYSGLPVGFYFRENTELTNGVEFGILGDQDPGEKIFGSENKYGLDFYSGYLSYNGKKWLKKFTIGDYALRFGQGVSMWSGLGMGKSGDAIGTLKVGQWLKNNTSGDENQFFRGVSCVVGYQCVNLVIFYSNKWRDANTDSDKVSHQSVITSFQSSGYHRTPSEIADERSLHEQVCGGYLSLNGQNVRFGFLYYCQNFNLPMTNGSAPYRTFFFQGKENSNIGVDYQLSLNHANLFGEVSRSCNGKVGAVNGMIWHLSPLLHWSCYLRYFDPEFHTFYGNALSESSGNRNELGIYNGFLIYPFRKLSLTTYFDWYRFPEITYSTSRPNAKGYDILSEVKWTLSENWQIFCRPKFEVNPQKITGGKGRGENDPDERRWHLRLHSNGKLSRKISLGTRFEWCKYDYLTTHEHGWMAYEEVTFKPSQKFSLWMRYGRFCTDGYNSRIYVYEHDLLYSFSIPEFHGTGSRTYLTVKWLPVKGLSVYLKGGWTHHQGADSWGSGNDQTRGPDRFDIRGMLQIRF